MYQTNGGCRLPCWWGFQPGLTLWEDARTFLEPIALSFYPPNSSKAWDYFYFKTPPEAEEISPEPRRQIYEVKNGIIESIEVQIFNLYPYSSLSNMVKQYGKPDEMWAYTGASYVPPGDTTTYFEVVTFYPSQGIMIRYGDHEAKIKASTIVGCPEGNGFGLTMLLWNPVEKFTFADRLQKSVEFSNDELLLPLEEATGVSVEAYYQSLINDSSPMCLETPIDLWP